MLLEGLESMSGTLTHSKAGSVKRQRHFHMLTNPEAHQRLVHRENIIPGRRES